MKRNILIEAVLLSALSIALGGCGKIPSDARADGDTGPLPAAVEADFNPDNFKLDHPEQFPLTAAIEHVAAPELNVTGLVSADKSREVSVPSLASGKVLEVNARLGDEVRKGQVLFTVRSTDIASARSDYLKAMKNQQSDVENLQLAERSQQISENVEATDRSQLERMKTLFDKGAKAKVDVETAQLTENSAIANLESAKTAVVNARIAVEIAQTDVETTSERLQLLEADADRSTGVVEVRAPVSGVITDQNITAAAGVQALTPPTPFTISDLSHVWVVCDVYENDLAKVHLGEYADIRLNAYPDRILKARIDNILPVLDPNIHTVKVRLELENPGLLRVGMFVTATFHDLQQEKRATVPATAVLHLHDREWVYMPAGNGGFRRVEVTAGNTLPDNMVEITSGVKPGDRVVANALVLQDTVEK
jgi:cobalt-zinc-cadmium efflux system membrane fusion protein